MKVILSVVLAFCAALAGAAEPQGKIDFNVRDYGGSVAKADEVRIYNGAASDLWVKTEHDTVSNTTFSRVTVDTGWTGRLSGLMIIAR